MSIRDLKCELIWFSLVKSLPMNKCELKYKFMFNVKNPSNITCVCVQLYQYYTLNILCFLIKNGKYLLEI
jgi:hypothetical protein